MGSVLQYGQLKMALASLQLAGMSSEVRRGGDEVAGCLRQSLPYFSPSVDKQVLSSHFTDQEMERLSHLFKVTLLASLGAGQSPGTL